MIFETQRCKIERFSKNDILSFMEYRNDMEWMKYQSFKGLSQTEYEKALLIQTSLNQGVQLAVKNKYTNELLGDLYLHMEDKKCTVGYTIHPKHKRKGYIVEVLVQLFDVLKTYDVNEVYAYVSKDNIASITLLQKLQFTLVETIEDEYTYKKEI